MTKSPDGESSVGSKPAERAAEQPKEKAIRARSAKPRRRQVEAAVSPLVCSSFRVYTPEELRNISLRPSTRPLSARGVAGEPNEGLEDASGPQLGTILKWAGVAVTTTALLFAGLIALANMTDDTLAPSKKSPARMIVKNEKDTKEAPFVSSTLTMPALGAHSVGTDFELPDDSVPVQRTATKRRVAPKQGKRSLRSSGTSVAIRNAPY